MSNLIQIKRSTLTAVPASLANGEVAYSFASSSNSMFIGDPLNAVPGTPLRVAGGKYSFLHQSNLISGSGGRLTANAVVITNANSFLDQFKTNTLVVGPDGMTNASATFVVSGTANISGNTTISGTLSVAGDTLVGGNVSFDQGTLFIDQVNNRVGINNTAPDTDLTITGNANVSGNVVLGGSLHTIAGNVNFDSRTLFIDSALNQVGINTNTTNLDASLKVVGTANVTSATWLGSTLNVVGAVTLANTLGATGAVTFANTLAVTGNATFSNSISVTGNSTFTSNVTMNGALQTIAGNVNFDTGTLFVDSVNNRVGITNTTPDASLTVTGTANVSGNSQVGGTLIVQGATRANNTLWVAGATTVNNTINVDGVATFSNTIAASSNVNVDAGTLFVDTVANRIGVNKLVPTVALDVVGDATISANLIANNILINADATINGNLAVNGTLTTIDTVNLVVEDPMFKVGKNNNVANNAGDAVDLGFYAVYANTTADMYTGFFRDATSGKYQLFKDLTVEPGATVDTAALSYKVATLITYLESGALTTNTTALAITANSTYSVAVAANTLSLSTALPVTSGGTGQQSFTAAGVIYGNGTGALQVTAAGANGDVLQVVNNLPAFGTLDGGSF